MLNYRLGTVNENHWGFKPVFRCSKPHTFSTFSGEEKEKNCPFILFTARLCFIFHFTGNGANITIPLSVLKKYEGSTVAIYFNFNNR